VQTEIDAVGKAGMAFVEHGQGFSPAAGETLFFPDFVQSARIAAVAYQEILAADPQPARDPDVDRIGLGKGALDRLRNGKQRHRCHGNARLTDRRHGTIDRTGR
jgi:hypothetical protein